MIIDNQCRFQPGGLRGKKRILTINKKLIRGQRSLGRLKTVRIIFVQRSRRVFDPNEARITIASRVACIVTQSCYFNSGRTFPQAADRSAAFFSFCRRFFSMGPHTWQYRQYKPLAQESGALQKKAQGMHEPRWCPIEPTLGSSALPKAGTRGTNFTSVEERLAPTLTMLVSLSSSNRLAPRRGSSERLRRGRRRCDAAVKRTSSSSLSFPLKSRNVLRTTMSEG